MLIEAFERLIWINIFDNLIKVKHLKLKVFSLFSINYVILLYRVFFHHKNILTPILLFVNQNNNKEKEKAFISFEITDC